MGLPGSGGGRVSARAWCRAPVQAAQKLPRLAHSRQLPSLAFTATWGIFHLPMTSAQQIRVCVVLRVHSRVCVPLQSKLTFCSKKKTKNSINYVWTDFTTIWGII